MWLQGTVRGSKGQWSKGLLKLPSPYQDWGMACQGPSSIAGKQEMPSSPKLWFGEMPGLECCGKYLIVF